MLYNIVYLAIMALHNNIMSLSININNIINNYLLLKQNN